MSEPDRIWIAPTHEASEPDDYYLLHPDYRNGRGSEYTRRDPAVLAALPEVQAMIAGAYEAAAREVDSAGDAAVTEALSQQLCCSGHMCGCQGADVGAYLLHLIRALPPADAIAARDAMIAEAAQTAWCDGRDAAATAAFKAKPLSFQQLEAIGGLTPSAAIRKRGEG